MSDEQLWSWVDRDAPELAEHLEAYPGDRQKVDELRRAIRAVAGSDRDDRIPNRIGAYPIRRRLGSGGMGVVFEADQPVTQRRVAIKVIRGAWLDDAHTRRLFFREAEVLGRLDHPGIARIFDAGETKEGSPFFAMELVDGLPLDEWAEGADLESRLDAIAQVARAVHHAHEKGVIHRDLKPSNVIVTARDEAKVLDFGLARIVDPAANASLTAAMSGKVIGTVRYMSPEQARGFASRVTPASDVYTLGVLLYELCAGALPHEFDGADLFECARKVAEETIQKPSSKESSLPGAVDRIVMRALAKDPAERYVSAADLAADLERFLAGEAVDAPELEPTGFNLARSIERAGQTIGAAWVRGSSQLARAAENATGTDRAQRARERSAEFGRRAKLAADRASAKVKESADAVSERIAKRRASGEPIRIDLNPAIDKAGAAAGAAKEKVQAAATKVREKLPEKKNQSAWVTFFIVVLVINLVTFGVNDGFRNTGEFIGDLVEFIIDVIGGVVELIARTLRGVLRGIF